MRDWPQNPIHKFKCAVFLDRDGTINVDTNFPHKIEELKIIPGAIDGILYLSKLSLEIIVVSNQAGIALGRFTRSQMSQFNFELMKRIKNAGAHIDAFYFCPHLEKKHLSPDDKPCECSKPSPGLLKEAAKDFDLELKNSFLIGDRLIDIEAGEKVGCITILVKTGKWDKNEYMLATQPTHYANNILEAAQIIESYL